MDVSALPVLLGFRELLLCVITAGVLAVVCFRAGYELGRDERSAHTVQGNGQNVSSGLPHSSDESRDRPASEDDESGIQVNMKKSYVMKLENRVTALEELLCGIRSETEIKSKELDRERQIHSTLKEKYEDTLMQNEALENDCELMFQTERANFLEKMLYMVAGQSEVKSEPDRERRADSTLNEKYDEMTVELDEDHELFQKDRANNLEKMLFARITLESKGLKREQQTDSIPKEKYDEPSKQNEDSQRDVNNEMENTHFMEEKLDAADGQSEERGNDLEERLPYCVLKVKYEELVKQNEQLYRSYKLLYQGDRGIYVDETLDDADAGHSEQNHEVALANIAEANAPSSPEYRENPTHLNSRLNDQVLQLTNRVRSQRSRLCDAEEMCANLIRALEQNQERQDYTHLWSQYEDSVATVANAKSITKDALEANTRLEYEKSVLIKHMELLAGTVGKMQEELCKTHKSHVKLFKSTLALENIKLRERVKTLQEKLGEENLKMPEETQEEQEKERLDHHNLLSQHEDIMIMLTKAEERAQTALEFSAKLMLENSNLKDKVKTLQTIVEDLDKQLPGTSWMF